MPASVENVDPTPFLVPTIDIGPFLADSTSSAARSVIGSARSACTTSGFFQVTGHGLPENVQRELFSASKKFFDLPLEEKNKLDAKTTIGRRGYDVLASQSYHNDVLPDLKEGFYVGHDMPLDDPTVKEGRFFMGPNVWPERSRLAQQDFQTPVEAYFQAIHSLALRVLDLIACTLPHGPKVFDQFTEGHTVAVLRLLHYPPAPKSSLKQLGAGAHTDFGAITLLLQDDNPGLEVLDPKTNEFVAVSPTPNAFVFNVGDMLSFWTGGQYKSSVHRVINKAPKDRYSAAFFYDGALDCPLTPLNSNNLGKVDEETLTVEKHMIKRITASYGLQGKA
jgi:isopenicillin N synthase-like dioxygenase